METDWTKAEAFEKQNPAKLFGLSGWIAHRQRDFDGLITFGSSSGPKMRARLIRVSREALAYHTGEGGNLEPGVEVEDSKTGEHGYFGGLLMDREGEYFFELRLWPTITGKRKTRLFSVRCKGDKLDRLRVRFETPFCDS